MTEKKKESQYIIGSKVSEGVKKVLYYKCKACGEELHYHGDDQLKLCKFYLDQLGDKHES